MLIRQYSIRTLLKVTTLCAVLSMFLHYAWSGRTWAICLAIAIVALMIFFIVQSLAFLLLWSIASSTDSAALSDSPFASRGPASPVLESAPGSESDLNEEASSIPAESPVPSEVAPETEGQA